MSWVTLTTTAIFHNRNYFVVIGLFGFCFNSQKLLTCTSGSLSFLRGTVNHIRGNNLSIKTGCSGSTITLFSFNARLHYKSTLVTSKFTSVVWLLCSPFSVSNISRAECPSLPAHVYRVGTKRPVAVRVQEGSCLVGLVNCILALYHHLYYGQDNLIRR